MERLCAVALEFAPEALSAQQEGEEHFEQQLIRCLPSKARVAGQSLARLVRCQTEVETRLCRRCREPWEEVCSFFSETAA